MKIELAVPFAFLFSSHLFAFSNFLENPYTPYPAGCATLPDLNSALYGENVVKYSIPDSGLVLIDANEPDANQVVDVSVGRVLCSETNRSIVWIEFSIPADLNPEDVAYMIRYVYVQYQGPNGPREHSMRLVAEPNTWGGTAIDGGGLVFGVLPSDQSSGHSRKWVFVVDNPSPFSAYFNGPDSFMTPEQYNGEFALGVAYNHGPYESREVIIPATSDTGAATASIPLNGRLSGIWGAEGARDQGVLISISELVESHVPAPNALADSRLLLFMSWNTFAADGSMMWLTGAAEFLLGDTQVTFPIETVNNGEFMGNKAANRAIVGSVTISGNNCNDLTFDYSLTSIGVGSGVRHLKRLFSLETAGYACRELASRIAARKE